MLDNVAAEVSLSADYSRLAAGLRAATHLVRGFADGASRSMSRLNLAPHEPKKGQSWLGSKTGQIGGNLAMSGIDRMIDAGKQVLDFEEKLVRFGVSTRKTGTDLRSVGDAARKTAAEVGTDSGKILDAAKAYTDLAGAENFTIAKMNILARASQASAADTGDLASMMYQLTRSMKITDAAMEDTIGGLINQAKDGAIEAKQMSKEFSAMLPIFARFKDAVGRDAVNQIGAMFQVTRDGFNSADEAGTGLVRVLAGIRTYASRFEKAGVRIWDVDADGVKKARSFADIFEDISKSKLVKDPELLKKAFGRTEGWRSMELLLEGAKSGRLQKLEESGRRNGVVMEDLATIANSASGRMSIAFEKMKNKFAEAMTPERIDMIASSIEKLAGAMGPLIGALDAVVTGFTNWGKLATRISIKSGSHHRKRGVDTGFGFSLDEVSGSDEDIRQENETRDQFMIMEREQNNLAGALKMAMRMAKNDGPEEAGETVANGQYRRNQAAAAKWYLEQRKNAGSERLKMLRDQVDAEDAAMARNWAAANPELAAAKAAPAEDALAAANQRHIDAAAAAEAAKPPWVDYLAKVLTESLTRGAGPWRGGLVVQIDGNKVAEADSNAVDKRRRGH